VKRSGCEAITLCEKRIKGHVGLSMLAYNITLKSYTNEVKLDLARKMFVLRFNFGKFLLHNLGLIIYKDIFCIILV